MKEFSGIDQHKKAFWEDTLIYSVLFNDNYGIRFFFETLLTLLLSLVLPPSLSLMDIDLVLGTYS